MKYHFFFFFFFRFPSTEMLTLDLSCKLIFFSFCAFKVVQHSSWRESPASSVSSGMASSS